MLEQPVIQQRGFRNVSQGGTITGFQVAIRLPYYRGVWLSQLRPATVTVDGVTYRDAAVTWSVAGKTYEQSTLGEHGDVHWNSLDPAVLTIRRPGGLTPGIHEVQVAYQWSASYMPPRMDLGFGGMARNPAARKIVLVR